MSFYMGRETGPPRGFIFSMDEMAEAEEEPLLGDSHGRAGRYTGVLKWKGRTTNLGIFTSTKECNAAWSRALARRKIRARKPAQKGYTSPIDRSGFKVNLYVNKKPTYIGTYATKEEARQKYLLAFHAQTKELLAAIGGN